MRTPPVPNWGQGTRIFAWKRTPSRDNGDAYSDVEVVSWLRRSWPPEASATWEQLPGMPVSAQAVDELDKAGPFGVVAALDWWPCADLTHAVARIRCLLLRHGGVFAVAGTDVPDTPRSSTASEQWTAALGRTGFRVTAVTSRELPPGHYSSVTERLRVMSWALRSRLGREVADCYLEHAALLDEGTQVGQLSRFGITAELRHDDESRGPGQPVRAINVPE